MVNTKLSGYRLADTWKQCVVGTVRAVFGSCSNLQGSNNILIVAVLMFSGVLFIISVISSIMSYERSVEQILVNKILL